MIGEKIKKNTITMRAIPELPDFFDKLALQYTREKNQLFTKQMAQREFLQRMNMQKYLDQQQKKRVFPKFK